MPAPPPSGILAVALLVLGPGLQGRDQGRQGPEAPPRSNPAPVARSKGKLKPVDINSAGKNELSFMLRIPEDVAARIVAGRPYRSKAQLLTRFIVSAEVYEAIKGKVIARQKIEKP